MIPGTTSKLTESTVASAATIDARTDIVHVTGSTSIVNINPSFGGGFGGILIVVPTDGAVATTAAGNIAVAVTMPQNRATLFVYSLTLGKWQPGAIS